MIPMYDWSAASERAAVEKLLAELRLDPVQLATGRGERAQQTAAVAAILADVAERGDAALVDSARKFDDPGFTVEQIRVTPEEIYAAFSRTPEDQIKALERSIQQVQEY